tara:strand:- start:1610 stop:2083 length:474 start_codon:yes stop_codon:yes gene_type:complete
MIKMGSKTYLRLIRDGVIADEHYVGTQQIPNFETGENHINIEDLKGVDLKEVLDEETMKLENGLVAVPGRGKYKGKLVKRKKNVRTKDLATIATKASVRVIKDHLPEINNHSNHFQDDDEALEKLIQELVASEMMKADKVDEKIVFDPEPTINILNT